MSTFSNSSPWLGRRAFATALVFLGLRGVAWAARDSTQAVSHDGLWHLSFEPSTHTLLLQDAKGLPLKRYAAPEVSLLARSTPLLTPVVIQTLPNRRSFVVAFGGCHALWEISYNPVADPIYDGLVHDYRLGEGLPKPGFLGVRRTRLEQPLDDFWVDLQSPHVLGRARWGQGDLQVINLDIRRARAHIALPDQASLVNASLQGEGNGRRLVIPVDAALAGSPTLCISTHSWTKVECTAIKNLQPLTH